MTSLTRFCTAALIVLGVSAETASAGVVSVEDGAVTFAARLGEANDLRIDFQGVDAGNETILFADAGAAIEASTGCESAESGAATCTAPESFTGAPLSVRLWDRSDRLEFDDCQGERRSVAVWGSTGNDTIMAGACSGLDLTVHGGHHDDFIRAQTNHSGINRLHGDDGRDRLWVSEGGRAFLYGGPNHDVLTWTFPVYDPGDPPTDFAQAHGDAGNDTFHLPDNFQATLKTIFGGNGNDTLSSQQGDEEPLVFDMAACQLCNIERVIGTPYDDEILGDERVNWIYGGDGNDTIDPRGDADYVYAGAGDDTVTTTDGGWDTTRCGDGHDELTADWRESIGECEVVHRASPGP